MSLIFQSNYGGIKGKLPEGLGAIGEGDSQVENSQERESGDNEDDNVDNRDDDNVEEGVDLDEDENDGVSITYLI